MPKFSMHNPEQALIYETRAVYTNKMSLTILNGIARITFCEAVPNSEDMTPVACVCTDLGNLKALGDLITATLEAVAKQVPGQPLFKKEDFN